MQVNPWLRVVLWLLIALVAFMAVQLILGAMSPGYAVAGVLLLIGAIVAAVRLGRARPTTS